MDNYQEFHRLKKDIALKLNSESFIPLIISEFGGN